MAKFNGKVKLKVAEQAQKNKFDLSCEHLTTFDFYDMRPTYIHEVMPNETCEVNVESFTRLSPLVEPFLGACRIRHHGFFVPMRVIMEGFNEFLTDTPYYFSSNSTPTLIHQVPIFYNTTLIQLFVNKATDPSNPYLSGYFCAVYDDAPDSWDFYSEMSKPLGAYYVFTQRGKKVYNLLLSLGYRINFLQGEDSIFSALPLLAFAKIFFDWFGNPAYDNFKSIGKYFSGQRDSLSMQDVSNILDTCLLMHYSSDYFVSAWDNPNSPNTSALMSTITIPDNESSTVSTSSRISTGSPNIGTPKIVPTSGVSNKLSQISQYMIDAVKHVSDYVKRKQLVGSRVMDRYSAEYGIQLNSAQLTRSISLGSNSCDITISDVMSTSDTVSGSGDGLGLGDYAGKGIGYSQNGHFKFTSDEFGYFMVLTYIEPKISYLHGRPRFLAHRNRLDFFTPEFDNLGVQAIRKDELFADATQHGYEGDELTNYQPDGIFGFAPRYAEYCVANSMVSGDFNLKSKNTSLDGWLLYRDQSVDTCVDLFTKDYVFKHNLAFTLADGQPYNNIFAQQATSPIEHFDHFFCQFRFGVTSFMPKMTLFDTYDFHSKGKELLMEVNGTQINS